MCSGKTKYIINDIYDIIVKQIVYTDVVHHVLCSIAMQLVETAFIIVSNFYVSLISIFLIILLKMLLLVMDFTSGEKLFHILMPLSNIDLFENCSLNRGVMIERLLRVSYVW